MFSFPLPPFWQVQILLLLELNRTAGLGSKRVWHAGCGQMNGVDNTPWLVLCPRTWREQLPTFNKQCVC